MTSATSRTSGIQRTLALILVLNAAVVGIKLVVGLRTGSLTVIGATLESALDAMNNIVAMIVVALAARGPDEDHPYGHDKFETVGALAIVGFLSISCFELIRGGVVRLLNPADVVVPGTDDLMLLGATALVNVVVVAYERRKAEELKSPLLLADSAHTMGDILVTALAIVSLVAARAGIPRADAVLAMVVALVVGWSGWKILRVTVPVLVDARGVSADLIRGAALRVAGVKTVPTVRSRTNSSGLVFADVTIRVAGDLRVAAAHTVADAVEETVREALDGAADVTVHVEPA